MRHCDDFGRCIMIINYNVTDVEVEVVVDTFQRYGMSESLITNSLGNSANAQRTLPRV